MREQIMTVREELHKMVDALPDEQIPELRQYLADLQASPDEELLSTETLAAIREGLEDIRGERVITVEEYRRTRGL